MGRYRKIDPRIHNDTKYKALSERGKLLFFTILTHPHMTALGAMRATEAGLCEEMALGTSGKDAGCPADCPSGRAAGIFENYRQAFRDLIEKDLIKFDPGNACLVIPNFLKYNPPESPSVVTAWNTAGDLIPECDLRDELIENTINFLQGYGKPDKDSFLKAFNLRPLNKQAAGQTEGQAGPQTDGQGAAHQEQEQEQEQDINTPLTPQRGNGRDFKKEFDEVFFPAYPRKVYRDKARKAYLSRGKKGELPAVEVLVQALENQRIWPQWAKDGGQFIPHPATWINGGCWDDKKPEIKSRRIGKNYEERPDHSVIEND